MLFQYSLFYNLLLLKTVCEFKKSTNSICLKFYSQKKVAEERMIEEETARRVEELVAKRVEEEVEKRKEEIEREVLLLI